MVYFLDTTYPGTKDNRDQHDVSRTVEDRSDAGVRQDSCDSYAFAGGDGIRALMFYEVEDSKVKEGADYIARGVINILKTVEGYKVDFLTVYPLAEAFQIIDMQTPAV